MVLNASAFPLPHADLQCFVQFINHIIAERRQNKTGRGGVLVRRCRSKPQVMGSRPASALSFSHVHVGDAFQFVHHIMAERRRNTTGRSGVVVGRCRSKPQVVGSRPASALSFSHVHVGDAFQFNNHIMAERRQNITGRSGVVVGRCRSKP